MIDELDWMDKPRNKEFARAIKHLAGKHDQATHGRGGGVVGAMPKDEQRAKEKAVWELHETGKTWEQVAKELGYANGGAARKAGMRHKERLDKEKDTVKPEPDVSPAKPKVVPKEGSEAIAQAQSIIDEATGGRSVADALADARPAGSMDPPTAKEMEITEAVVQAGAVLRAEVSRRIELLGGDNVRKARVDLDDAKKELEIDDANVKRLQDVEVDLDRQMGKVMIESGELDRQIGKQMDVSFVERPAHPRLRELHSSESGQRLIRDDVHEMIRLERDRRATRGGGADLDEWVDKKTAERFPGDKTAQRAYKEALWSMANRAEYDARNGLTASDKKFKTLSNKREKAMLATGKAISERYDTINRIKVAEQVIQNGGLDWGSVADRQTRLEVTRSVLGEFGRTFSRKEGQRIKGTDAAVSELRTELENIPDQLWDAQQFPNLNVKVTSTGRGHWNKYDQTIKATGKAGEPRRLSTLLHEAMHATEDMNPQIQHLEFVMFERRARGRKPESLKKLQPGRGYSASETAVADEWTSPYSGKRYGSSRRSSHEIMTMGMESLFRRSGYPTAIADDDHLNFVMGVLAFA